MIKNKGNGTYIISNPNNINLPYDLKANEIISKINGFDPTPKAIASLFTGKKDEKVELTLTNDFGGTYRPKRTITITYPNQMANV